MARSKEINHLEEQQERCKVVEANISQFAGGIREIEKLKKRNEEQHQIKMAGLEANKETHRKNLGQSLLELYELENNL